jgi:hypothetical protein
MHTDQEPAFLVRVGFELLPDVLDGTSTTVIRNAQAEQHEETAADQEDRA